MSFPDFCKRTHIIAMFEEQVLICFKNSCQFPLKALVNLFEPVFSDLQFKLPFSLLQLINNNKAHSSIRSIYIYIYIYMYNIYIYILYIKVQFLST